MQGLEGLLSDYKLMPGTILVGPMANVDHEKFYIIAGVSQDKLIVCSVVINSNINPFIQKRPKLLACQYILKHSRYSFLKYDSFVNCAQPHVTDGKYFSNDKYKIVDTLSQEDTQNIIDDILNSDSLTGEQIKIFFGK